MLLNIILSPWLITGIVAAVGAYVLARGEDVERNTFKLLLMCWGATWYFFFVADGPLIAAYGVLDCLAGVALYLFRQQRWQYVVIYLFAAMMFVHAAVSYSILFGGEAGLAYSVSINILFVGQLLVTGFATWQAGHEGGWMDRLPYWPAARAWLLAPSYFGGKGTKGA